MPTEGLTAPVMGGDLWAANPRTREWGQGNEDCEWILYGKMLYRHATDGGKMLPPQTTLGTEIPRRFSL